MYILQLNFKLLKGLFFGDDGSDIEMIKLY
jgi:hypothetical protein